MTATNADSPESSAYGPKAGFIESAFSTKKLTFDDRIGTENDPTGGVASWGIPSH